MKYSKLLIPLVIMIMFLSFIGCSHKTVTVVTTDTYKVERVEYEAPSFGAYGNTYIYTDNGTFILAHNILIGKQITVRTHKQYVVELRGKRRLI